MPDLPDPLRVDPERYQRMGIDTGIYVRAEMPGGFFGDADISDLDRDSLERWLRSAPRIAERTVVLLLGHHP